MSGDERTDAVVLRPEVGQKPNRSPLLVKDRYLRVALIHGAQGPEGLRVELANAEHNEPYQHDGRE